MIQGTLHYLAPEQTGRLGRTIDERTDLYALGITLYELFTGGARSRATTRSRSSTRTSPNSRPGSMS